MSLFSIQFSRASRVLNLLHKILMDLLLGLFLLLLVQENTKQRSNQAHQPTSSPENTVQGSNQPHKPNSSPENIFQGSNQPHQPTSSPANISPSSNHNNHQSVKKNCSNVEQDARPFKDEIFRLQNINLQTFKKIITVPSIIHYW